MDPRWIIAGFALLVLTAGLVTAKTLSLMWEDLIDAIRSRPGPEASNRKN